MFSLKDVVFFDFAGKKQKKNKWKAVDPTLIINTSALPIKPVSWAEAAEEDGKKII